MKIFVVVEEVCDHWCPIEDPAMIDLHLFTLEKEAQDFVIEKRKTQVEDDRIYWILEKELGL